MDTRSDVYALGVLLYELLAGRTPFNAEALKAMPLDEMVRTLREIEPPRPSELVDKGSIPRELDWIVMKALEKEPGRRYVSAGGMSDDVERYLRREPVEAGAPGMAYRLAKFVRKNRLQVAAAVLVVLALLSGASLAMRGFLRAAASENLARQDAETAKEINRFMLEDLLMQDESKGQIDPGLNLIEVHFRAGRSRLDRGFRDQPLVEAEARMILAEAFERQRRRWQVRAAMPPPMIAAPVTDETSSGKNRKKIRKEMWIGSGRR